MYNTYIKGQRNNKLSCEYKIYKIYKNKNKNKNIYIYEGDMRGDNNRQAKT